MSLWEHFDHLELNPLKDMGGRTPPLHAHLLHPDFRTGPRTQPEAHTDETPPPATLEECFGHTGSLRSPYSRDYPETGITDSCELPHGYWELNPGTQQG